MNTIRQFKLKLQIRIEPAIEFGSELLRDMWQQVLAEREARIRLMTEGHFYAPSGTLKQGNFKPE